FRGTGWGRCRRGRRRRGDPDPRAWPARGTARGRAGPGAAGKSGTRANPRPRRGRGRTRAPDGAGAHGLDRPPVGTRFHVRQRAGRRAVLPGGCLAGGCQNCRVPLCTKKVALWSPFVTTELTAAWACKILMSARVPLFSPLPVECGVLTFVDTRI